MTFFILNIFLTVVWVLLNSSYGILDFILGFIISYFVIVLSHPLGLKESYIHRVKNIFLLIGHLLYETLLSSSKIAWDVLTPNYISMPDIVKVPLDIKSDIEVTLLANMISLTPGTLVLDIAEDKKYMIIHAMFAKKHAEVVSQIKTKLEQKILRISNG